ncbi:MAG: AbgT family transporter [Oscillospiraceae bacterium]
MASTVKTQAKKKREFKMPHLFFLMLGLIMLMSLATYIIPAGQFATDPATGKLMGDSFAYIGEQTHVSPWKALTMLLQGFMNSSYIMSLLLIGGGTVGVIMATGAIDEIISWAIYKLNDKGVTVLVPLLFFIIAIQGAFGGGDQMIAIVPMGIMFAKKLKLDPIAAVGVSFFASFVGFAVGPTRAMTPQIMMGITPYSGFGVRVVIMFLIIFIGLGYTLWYALRVAKDPSKSFMGNTDWLSDCTPDGEAKKVDFNPRAALITLIFFGQYAVIVYMNSILNMGVAVMPGVMFISCILCGLIKGMSFDDIGNAFAKGTAGMAFVAAIIGMAGTMSLVMSTGNILHTIVYVLASPLKGLGQGLASIGISLVVTIINIFIPSASAKQAILIPIIQPMAEALSLSGNLAVCAFMFGDGFTNLITPALGVTAGSLALCGVPINKWLKFALPIVGIMVLASFVILFGLGSIGWTGL